MKLILATGFKQALVSLFSNERTSVVRPTPWLAMVGVGSRSVVVRHVSLWFIRAVTAHQTGRANGLLPRSGVWRTCELVMSQTTFLLTENR